MRISVVAALAVAAVSILLATPARAAQQMPSIAPTKDSVCPDNNPVPVGRAAPSLHSLTVEFDINRMVTVSGVITEMKWTNPHAWLYIDVKDEKGLVRNRAIEFGSPNALYRRGWRQTDLPPRNIVTVTGYPSLDQSLRISATDVKLPDGRTLFAGSPIAGASKCQRCDGAMVRWCGGAAC